MGGVVRLLGARDDVADLMVACDVVAVPSRVEGMPGAVLEAMALERPIVASDIPMVREALGDDTAALVPVDDADALASMLERALRVDHSVAITAARKRFDEHFAPSPIVERLAVLYRQAISASRWPRRPLRGE